MRLIRSLLVVILGGIAPAQAQFWGGGGIPIGTTAARPTACHPGQAYFALDAAENLWLCTNNNTWTPVHAGTVTNGVYTTGAYSDPSWLTISKSKVGLGNVENTALSTWAGSLNLTIVGALTNYLKAPKQINFSLWDPNVPLAAGVIPGLWRAEYGPATLVSVACMANVANVVIQMRKTTSINMLSANLVCGNGTWASSSSFAVASLAQNDDIGLQIVSGAANRINVSVQYTQQ